MFLAFYNRSRRYGRQVVIWQLYETGLKNQRNILHNYRNFDNYKRRVISADGNPYLKVEGNGPATLKRKHRRKIKVHWTKESNFYAKYIDGPRIIYTGVNEGVMIDYLPSLSDMKE